MSRLASLLVLACSSFGLVGASSVNSLAVEYQSTSEREISIDGRLLPVFEIFYKPRSTAGEIISIKEVEKIPSGVVVSGAYGMYARYPSDASIGAIFYLIYDPASDTIYLPVGPPTQSISRVVVNRFLDSWVYKSFVQSDDTIDFLNVEGLTGTITQSVGKMIAVGLLLGIGLLSFKVGITSLDKFLDQKFWYKRFQNERSALEKEYKRLSRVYRNDPQGQKNLDRRFSRRNTRLYEKYADYGVEKEDLVRTE